MKKIFLFVLVVLSCSENSSSNTPTESVNVLEIESTEKVSGLEYWKQAFGIDNFNRFYQLRGEYFLHKLDPIYCATASKLEENLRDLPWGKGLSIENSELGFPSFMNLIRIFIIEENPVIVSFRGVIEGDPRFFAETERKGHIEQNGDYIIEEVDINVRYTVRIVTNDIFKIKMEIDHVNTKFIGFFVGTQPQMVDDEGFTTFYRVNGPGMLYKEWPDGTYDPRKEYVEWNKLMDSIFK